MKKENVARLLEITLKHTKFETEMVEQLNETPLSTKAQRIIGLLLDDVKSTLIRIGEVLESDEE